ncbi:unnamed protein product [Gordionus sp. m RMFG-2023]
MYSGKYISYDNKWLSPLKLIESKQIYAVLPSSQSATYQAHINKPKNDKTTEGKITESDDFTTEEELSNQKSYRKTNNMQKLLRENGKTLNNNPINDIELPMNFELSINASHFKEGVKSEPNLNSSSHYDNSEESLNSYSTSDNKFNYKKKSKDTQTSKKEIIGPSKRKILISNKTSDEIFELPDEYYDFIYRDGQYNEHIKAPKDKRHKLNRNLNDTNENKEDMLYKIKKDGNANFKNEQEKILVLLNKMQLDSFDKTMALEILGERFLHTIAKAHYNDRQNIKHIFMKNFNINIISELKSKFSDDYSPVIDMLLESREKFVTDILAIAMSKNDSVQMIEIYAFHNKEVLKDVELFWKQKYKSDLFEAINKKLPDKLCSLLEILYKKDMVNEKPYKNLELIREASKFKEILENQSEDTEKYIYKTLQKHSLSYLTLILGKIYKYDFNVQYREAHKDGMQPL